MEKECLQAARAWVRNELDRSSEFWLRHGLDDEHGGVYTCLTRDGRVYSTEKSVGMQGCCAWTCAFLCRMYGKREEWLRASRSCLQFLEEHGTDQAAGERLYDVVTAEGRPLRRQTRWLAEGACAMANAEYYGQTGERPCLERARRACRLVYTGTQSGRIRTLADPMLLLQIAGLLRRVDPEQMDLYNRYAAECVHDILAWHCKPELGCTLERVGPNGELLPESADGRAVDPGRCIECSRLLMEEAGRTGNTGLRRKAEDIFRMAAGAGWDREYGGLFSRLDRRAGGKEPKLWWAHSELLAASLTAYRDTGREEYLDWFCRGLDYCKAHFADPPYGEWFGWLHRDGSPVEPVRKGSLDKGPFRLPRGLAMADNLLGQILGREEA